MINSIYLVAAAVVTFATAMLHIFGGAKTVMAPVRSQQWAAIVEGSLDVVWHTITLLLLGCAGLFAYAAYEPLSVRSAVVAGGIVLSGMAGLFLWITAVRFLSLWDLPQWLFLGPAGLFALAGTVGAGVVGTIAILFAALFFGAASLLHWYWALGGLWPFASAEQFVTSVVGSAAGRHPSRGTTVLVAICLGAAAVALLSTLFSPSAAGWCWGIGGVVAVRGLGGFFEARFRPTIRGLPYERLNRGLYSPLCSLVALAVVVGLLA